MDKGFTLNKVTIFAELSPQDVMMDIVKRCTIAPIVAVGEKPMLLVDEATYNKLIELGYVTPIKKS